MVTYRNYPNETVILDGTGLTFGTDGLFFIQRTNYIRVTGLEIQNSSGAGINVHYADYIEFDNLYVHRTQREGIGAWGTTGVGMGNYITIHDNEVTEACWPVPEESMNSSEEFISMVNCHNSDVYNNVCHDGYHYPTGTLGNGGEGIGIRDGCTDVDIHDNEVYHIRRLGIGVPCFDETTGHDITIQRNSVHDISNHGYTCHSEYAGSGAVQDVYFYNNLAYNCTEAAFCHPVYSGDQPKTNIQWINNTAYNCGYGFRAISINLHSIVIRNNIFCANTVNIDLGAEDPTEFTIDHNLFYDPTTATGIDYVQDDPHFVTPGSNFHLQAGSHAIGAGSLTGAPSDDFDGVTRGVAVDIGPYEYV